VVLAALPRRLTDQQAGVVAGIAASGNRIDVLEALAGTGKTTCAEALGEVYERAGYRVIGAAPTARAVRELKERAGIGESRTLDGWAGLVAINPDGLLLRDPASTAEEAAQTVLIIDEAGMANTRVSANVIDRAIAANVKVIAIGDSGQLSSVRAGGWLGALSRRFGSFELREVMRQRDPAERRALAKLHRGEPESYLEPKRARGELHVFSGEYPGVEAERQLVARWAAATLQHGETESVMICRDNRRRERLNELARAHLREEGKLGDQVEVAGASGRLARGSSRGATTARATSTTACAAPSPRSTRGMARPSGSAPAPPAAWARNTWPDTLSTRTRLPATACRAARSNGLALSSSRSETVGLAVAKRW
jgi:ATP-dependent exoDNAse (exonuclease V) alpha subunit